LGEGAFRTPILDRVGGRALARLILDTTILISAERGASKLEEIIGDEDDVVIAAITAGELLVGVELADRRRRPARQRYVELVLSKIPIEPYDLGVARSHAVLLTDVKRKGRPRGAHDLLIAATALATQRAIVTSNSTHFEDLPGVPIHMG